MLTSWPQRKTQHQPLNYPHFTPITTLSPDASDRSLRHVMKLCYKISMVMS